MKTYIATEPEAVTGFQDQRGVVHTSRDAAILSNFDYDLSKECAEMDFRRELERLPFEMFLRRFAEQNPDMLRVLLGDRDYT